MRPRKHPKPARVVIPPSIEEARGSAKAPASAIGSTVSHAARPPRAEPDRSAPPRLSVPDRQQLLSAMTIDELLEPDHPARAVWAYVERLDLTLLFDRIRARGRVAGRPAIDPRLLVALWLYATLSGFSSARELADLCLRHDAFRWLAGGVSVNYHTRRASTKKGGEGGVRLPAPAPDRQAAGELPGRRPRGPGADAVVPAQAGGAAAHFADQIALAVRRALRTMASRRAGFRLSMVQIHRARRGVPGRARAGQGAGAVGAGEVPQDQRSLPEGSDEPAGADQQSRWTRTNRMIRFLEEVRYKWRRRKTLVRFVVLRLDHIWSHWAPAEVGEKRSPAIRRRPEAQAPTRQRPHRVAAVR